MFSGKTAKPQPGVTVRASKDRYPYFADPGHRPLGYWRIPVTDLIPLERVNSGETGGVYLQGVNVRFIVNMAASTSVVGAMYNAKIQSDPVAISNGVDGRPEYFTMGTEGFGMLLSTGGVGMVTNYGPFAIVSGRHGISPDSPDGSLHLARINMGRGGPVGEAQWRKERMGSVFKQDFQMEGPPQLGSGGYEENYVEVYFEVEEWFEYGSNDGGSLEFKRPLEIVMGVKSKAMKVGGPPGGLEAGVVTGVIVDVYWGK